jgi:hypothetical protein
MKQKEMQNTNVIQKPGGVNMKKKPIIKKSKLDLRKKQMKKDSLKKSNPNLLTSSVVNKPEEKKETRGIKKNRPIWPNQKTFENFLQRNKIKFVKRDTIFILRDLGALGDCLYEDRFKRFVFSNVWEP